ncbi:hypothetical protein BGZ61DRAFT_439884, partial [Ilyonectria robusta]|uniref:uncharacterized protein n=1 Tax=Ilyonectria robusta TaxID=1079257 RepID=UPI001E8D8F65
MFRLASILSLHTCMDSRSCSALPTSAWQLATLRVAPSVDMAMCANREPPKPPPSSTRLT